MPTLQDLISANRPDISAITPKKIPCLVGNKNPYNFDSCGSIIQNVLTKLKETIDFKSGKQGRLVVLSTFIRKTNLYFNVILKVFFTILWW